MFDSRTLKESIRMIQWFYYKKLNAQIKIFFQYLRFLFKDNSMRLSSTNLIIEGQSCVMQCYYQISVLLIRIIRMKQNNYKLIVLIITKEISFNFISETYKISEIQTSQLDIPNRQYLKFFCLINTTHLQMFRSLMFKSNPLTEELHRYENKMQFKFKESSLRKNKSKQFAKQSHQRSTNHSEFINNHPRKSFIVSDKIKLKVSPKLRHIDYKLSPKMDSNVHKNLLQAKQTDEGIFSNNTISHQAQTVKKTTLLSQKDRKIHPDPKKQNHEAFRTFSKNSAIEEKNYSKRKYNFFLNDQYQLQKQIIGPRPPKEGNFVSDPTKKNAEEMKNQLKSNLYKSIDLGNLFQKVEQKMNKDDKFKIVRNQYRNQPGKPQKLLQVKSHEQNIKSSSKIKQFNLKNLMDRNKNCKQTQNQSQLIKSYCQNLTTRDKKSQSIEKNNSLTGQLDLSNYQNPEMLKTCRTSIRKRSSMIVIDDNGNVHQDQTLNSNNDDENHLKMSMKISNLKQMMKEQQLSFE